VSYTLDRFRAVALGTSLGFSSAKSTTAPADFSQSYLATVTSAKSVEDSNQARIDQFIEGYNVANLKFGTANAKTITLSFWVRSSITGTYCVHIGNNQSPTRSFVAEYTISSANTFEYKTITISGDTTGTWATNKEVGLGVSFALGMGSNFTGLAGWQEGEKCQTSNQTQWIGTAGATFYITGVQLEVGEEATPFEHRPYDVELSRCQRYFKTVGDGILGCGRGEDSFYFSYHFENGMRATPTMSLPFTKEIKIGNFVSANYVSSSSTLTSHRATSNSAVGILLGFTGITEGQPLQSWGNSPTCWLACDAEL